MTSGRWNADRIPDLTDRTFVVTGSNSGLGLATTRHLAGHGAVVVMAVRNKDKGQRAADEIRAAHPGAKLEVRRVDLADLDSVRSFAAGLHERGSHIDGLINNAGVMGPPRSLSPQGDEIQFAGNHLGHFALTGLLLDRLLPVPGSRVVTVSSTGHRIRAAIHFDDLQWERSYSRAATYGQSKLANLMFTYELQRRLAPHGTTVAVAAHPGVSNTELIRNTPAAIRLPVTWLAPLLTQKPDMGALPTLRAATDPAVSGGQYHGPGGRGEIRGYPKPVTSSPDSHDQAVQQRLWTVSEELTGVTFPVR